MGTKRSFSGRSSSKRGATVESAGAGGGVERAGVADGERHEVAERRVDGGLDDGDGESGVHGLRAKRGGEGDRLVRARHALPLGLSGAVQNRGGDHRAGEADERVATRREPSLSRGRRSWILVGRARHAVRDATEDARRAGRPRGSMRAAVNAADMALVSSVEARRQCRRARAVAGRVVVDLNADSRKCQLA